MRITDRGRICGLLALSAALAGGYECARPAFTAEPLSAPSRPAREVVWEFERSLRPLSEEERRPKVRQFFAGLKDSNARLAAITMLDSRYVYVVPKSMMDDVLAPLLRDPDVQVRARAARAVAYNGLGSHHAEALLALLKTDDVAVKSDALLALGRSRDERFLAPIRAELANPDPRVRIFASWSLHTLQPSAPELEPLLADTDAAVRAAVVQLLPTSPGARRLLADPVPTVRQQAARTIGDGGDPKQAAAITPLLQDPDPQVRAAAAYALGHLKATAYGTQIAALLRAGEDVVVRRSAAKALAELRSELHLPNLRAALRDEDEAVRHAAERAIRLIEDPQLNPDSVQ